MTFSQNMGMTKQKKIHGMINLTLLSNSEAHTSGGFSYSMEDSTWKPHEQTLFLYNLSSKDRNEEYLPLIWWRCFYPPKILVADLFTSMLKSKVVLLISRTFFWNVNMAFDCTFLIPESIVFPLKHNRVVIPCYLWSSFVSAVS